jgi:predicted RNase H-like HicB family nuclease
MRLDMRLSEEITFVIGKDRESGWFVASWDNPAGGGITTQGKDLAELQANLKEAVQCHFKGQVEDLGDYLAVLEARAHDTGERIPMATVHCRL